MKRIIIVGGGTAGWLTALYVQQHIPYCQIKVIASSKIGILGAGEGTSRNFIPFIRDVLKINTSDFFVNCRATIKNALKFTNWNNDGKFYFHTLGSNEPNDLSLSATLDNRVMHDYNGNRLADDGLHFDAQLVAKHLEKIGLSRGITLIDDIIEEIETDNKNNISAFKLTSGNRVKTDFVFDCSGFKRLIIGNFYKTKWHSYEDILPLDRSIPFFIPNDGIDGGDLPPYTECISMKHGWMWKIPVQGRYGCGYSFDSRFASDDEIKEELKNYLGYEITNPTVFSYKTGCYEKAWVNNCIAIGLASGFVEPLEGTSIGTTVQGLLLLDNKKEGMLNNPKLNLIDAYNHALRHCNEEISNFIHLHYLAKRSDTEFWRQFKEKNKTPEFIKNLISFGEKLNEKDLDYLLKVMPTKKVSDQIDTFDFNSWKRILTGTELQKNWEPIKVDVSHLQKHNEFLRSQYDTQNRN